MNQLKRLRKSGTTKNLVKKYKVTGRIATRSSSIENNKQVDCHQDDDNDDDLYAKNRMIMDCVNDDCLAEIFMYVPAYERPQIALVCKKWKRALDTTWFNVKKIELTHWEYDEYPNFLKKNYPTLDGQFNFLKSLLYKCGRYLRELDLSVYPKCNILPIINEYCPNLEKLGIRIDNIDDIDDAISSNAFTNLSKLKVLKIIFHRCLCGVHPLVPTTLINSLLNVADTLTDLSMLNWHEAMQLEEEDAHFPEEMTSVVPQLKALKKLVMFGLSCSKSLRDSLNNSETIEICDDTGIIVPNKRNVSWWKYNMPLSGNIEVLNIIDWPITDDDIYNIANTMKRLHTLNVSCSRLTDAGIVTCTKMNNLHSLIICGSNNVTDSSIKLLKNLRYLCVPFSNKITDESVIEVLENSPYMRKLIVQNTGITHKFIEKALKISSNRKRQLEVWATCEFGMGDTAVRYQYLSVYYPI